MEWLNQQPVWLQVVLGLVIFFVLGPWLIAALLRLRTACLSMGSAGPEPAFPSPPAILPEPDRGLFRVCEACFPARKAYDLVHWLNGMTQAEKHALQLSPLIRQKAEELGIEL